MEVKNCKSIHSFNVMDEIKRGKIVFGVDRYELECFEVNTLTVNKLANILSETTINTNRFDFWSLEVNEDE